MKANQKYFPLLDASGKLTNKFLIVSNISPKDPSKVIGGNERVVRPRLADAKFFFDQDRKKTLEGRLEGLGKVVYHNKLGSQGERNTRVVAIAKAIAAQLGDASLVSKVELAAKLSKADLITDMVGEFPELQGIMGRYYAQHEGLDSDVAFAIEDHYKPRFAGDELPRSQVGVIVALADKLETLVGMFGIGNIPTGDKDPFALKRHAIGITRILIEKNLPIDFSWLIKESISAFPVNISSQIYEHSITDFIFDRLANAYKDQDFTSNQVEAVLGTLPLPQRLGNIPNCLIAVKMFAELDESESLASANKRVSNILKKAIDSMSVFNKSIQRNDLVEPAEITLFDALTVIKPKADKLFEAGDYTASLQALAALKAPVDDFFDNVMVNADDPALKANRLGLLATLHQTMNRVADLSKLAS
jgi:glycyl-tRNA synthetase beta chain